MELTTAAASSPRHEVIGLFNRIAAARRYAVPSALLGLVGLGAGILIYATTPRGAGVETDAVNYLSAAASLSQGTGYLGWDDQLLPYFPPGYPLLIAALRLLTGVGVDQVAQAADIALFAGLVLATYALACRVIKNQSIRRLVAAAVAFSPVVLGVYALVSSETLFNLLCVAALIAACEVLANPPGSSRYRVAYAVLGVITASAMLTRLAGVALVLSLALTIVAVARRAQRLVARARVSVGFGILVLAPISAWDVFLQSQTGNWTFGSRPPSTVGLSGNILTAAQTLAGWAAPPSAIFTGWGWLDLLVAAVTFVALAAGLGEVLRRPVARLRAIAPVLVFCLVYPVVMILLSSGVDLAGALDDRYLSPLLAPLVVLVGFGIQMAWTNARRHGWLGRGLALAIIGAVSVSLASSLVQTGRAALQGHAAGISGVTTANWSNMDVLRAVRRLPVKEGELLLSNLPEMMTYSTGSLYQYPPERGGGIPDDLRRQVRTQGSAYLVLLTAFDDPSLYTPDQLAQWFTVRTLYSGPDGQLVELTTRGGLAG